MRVYSSEHPDLDLPHLDVLTLLFDSKYGKAKEDTEIHVQAEDPTNSITKREARTFVKQVAYVLRNVYGFGGAGEGKDTLVCTSSGNPFLPIFFYSTIAAGGIYSGASTAFTVSELSRQTKDADAKLLICSAEYAERNKEVAKQCGIVLERVLVLDATIPKQWKLLRISDGADVLELGCGRTLDWRRTTDLKTLQNTTTCLLYSSGTTGLPKGVRLSNWNLLACNLCILEAGDRYIDRRRKEGHEFFFRAVAHLPMAHIAGISLFTLNPFCAGGTTYWMKKFELDPFIEYCRRYRPTFQFSVPPIWLLVSKSDKVTDHFDSVEIPCAGAAPMGAELQRDVRAKLGKGKAYMTQNWGTTETTGTITALDWDIKDETGSVGCIPPNVRLRVVDDDGNDVDPGQEGEMLVAGPIVSQGYHNRPEATRESFVDGFYRTGDIGLVKNGLVYIVDRKKELIKYKGLQVAPAELEAHLISHPNIADAAVIGVFDASQSTELPRAYVVATEPSLENGIKKRITEQEVKDFVKSHLASHKQLRGGVVFLDAIPKSPSGKILRKELRQEAAKEGRTAKL